MAQPADIPLMVMAEDGRHAPHCDFSMLLTTPVVIFGY